MCVIALALKLYQPPSPSPLCPSFYLSTHQTNSNTLEDEYRQLRDDLSIMRMEVLTHGNGGINIPVNLRRLIWNSQVRCCAAGCANASVVFLVFLMNTCLWGVVGMHVCVNCLCKLFVAVLVLIARIV